jgi:hypothetical protein
MSEGKQEAREHESGGFACKNCGLVQSLWKAYPLCTGQPQEKAQPESGEMDVESLSAKFHEIYQAEAKRQGDVRHKDAYADLPENIKEFDRVLARYVIGLVQRGQQAMAEKAAQHCDKIDMPQLAEYIRSLASTELPQGEAEKEGRT